MALFGPARPEGTPSPLQGDSGGGGVLLYDLGTGLRELLLLQPDSRAAKRFSSCVTVHLTCDKVSRTWENASFGNSGIISILKIHTE